MSTCIPSNTPTTIKTEGYIRQNPWQALYDNKFQSVITSKTIHFPWAHTKDVVDNINQNGEFISPYIIKGYKYTKICKEFPDGTLVFIPDGKKGLIVQLTSSMKTGIINTLCIACTPRNCGHNYISSCEICHSSLKEVFNTSNTEKLLKYLKDGCIIEPFYCAYRDIEIVSEVNLDDVNASSMSGPASAGKWIRYWTLV